MNPVLKQDSLGQLLQQFFCRLHKWRSSEDQGKQPGRPCSHSVSVCRALPRPGKFPAGILTTFNDTAFHKALENTDISSLSLPAFLPKGAVSQAHGSPGSAGGGQGGTFPPRPKLLSHRDFNMLSCSQGTAQSGVTSRDSANLDAEKTQPDALTNTLLISLDF